MHQTISEQAFGRIDDELFQSMKCIVMELDTRGRLLRMNPFAEDLFGMNSGEAAGKPFVGAIAPKQSSTGRNQDGAFENLIHPPEENATVVMEVRISNGTLKNIVLSPTPHFDSNGEMEKIVCLCVDREAYVKRERNFQKGFDLLESFLEASKVSAFSVNSEHRFYYASPGIECINGYLPEEVVGQTPDDFFEPGEAMRIAGLIQEGIEKRRRNIHLVNQVRHKEGTSAWCEMDAAPSFSEKGEFEGLVGISRNIDKEKAAELAMAEKEKEFQFCFKHAQVLLIVTDEDGVIRDINRAGAKMYGRQPEEIVGHVLTEFLPDFERERVLQMFKRDFRAAMAKKETRTVGMGGILNKIQTSEGLKDILFYKTGVKVFKDGKFEGILNTAIDITEVVKVREELKRHRDQLEQLVVERTAELQGLQEEVVRRERLTALGKMANVISQEIRTPLSTISNSFFVINERLKEKGIGVKKSLERANRAIQRCYSIVDEFKIFTQTDDLKKNVTEIDIWLNGILDQLSMEKGICVVRELVSGVTTEIDRQRVERAIVNVIENALQAKQARNEGRIIVKSQLAFNRLEIEIVDEGIGIDRKDLEVIFEPLFSTKSFGLGLGLPIAMQIMEQHGGGISIESEKGKGTKVLLWLPVDQTII